MYQKYIQKVPYSFSKDRFNNLQRITQKYTIQPQTNEASDTSEFLQSKYDKQNSKNYRKLIKSLTQQNDYYKQALKTAQNLIKNYQQQSNTLKQENAKLQSQVNQITVKLQNLQRLLIKLFECQKKNIVYCKTEIQSPKSCQKMFMKQNLKTFYENNNEDSCISIHNIQNKIQKIIDQQFRYEEQIFQLNKKIKQLNKINQTQSNIKDKQRNKIKTVNHLPFTTADDNLKKQKQRIKNQIIDIYGNEKTIKTINPKQSQFKNNLQKQFAAFLNSKKNSIKSKQSCSKVLFPQNKESCISISASCQKKNRRKTISLKKY